MDTFEQRGRGPWRGLVLVALLASTAALAQLPPPGGGNSGGGAPTPPPPAGAPPPAGGGNSGGGSVPTSGSWGSFKTDKCTKVGFVQKSSILHGIQGSWENACYHTGATIDGYTFEHPARCVNTGINMWGEFDVPSKGCTPNWGGFKADGCRGVGIRQYSSRLMNIRDIDWNDACMQMPALINGVHFDQPTRCRTTRASGQWGEFDVRDASCP